MMPMSSQKRVISNLRLIFITTLFLFMLLQLIGLSLTVISNPSSRIGFSNITIYTSDVTNTGLEVPEEYQNELAMIQFSDDEPIEGDTVIINATIFNIGTRSADVTVYFYDGPPLDGDLIGIENLSIHALGFNMASTLWDTKGEDEFHTIYVLVNPDDPANETDDENNNATKDIVVNQIPLAAAGSNQEVNEDDSVLFDARGSTDTLSDITPGLLYIWDFNDPFSNTSNPGTQSGINLTQPAHIFTGQGMYNINLTVEDDGGARAWDTLTVTVKNINPTAGTGASLTTADEDEEIVFSAGSSQDTPSDRLTLRYYWNYGDGSNSGWINNTEVGHTFTDAGTYDVELIVQDDNNITDSETLMITIKNVAPVADAGEDQGVFGNTVFFNASGSLDTPSDMNTLEYEWNFGDGSRGYGVSVNHSYDEKGTYTVTIKVTDDDGESSTDTVKVTVSNLSPIALIIVERVNADEDEEILFNASGSYDPDGNIISYNWDFGDGAASSDMITSHAYTSTGSYLVTLLVEDDNNILRRDTKIITINNVPPVADAGTSLEVYYGEDVLFDAGKSNDTKSDLGSLQYLWDFGDDNTGEGQSVIHSFERAGIYNVTLEVIDDDDERDIDTIKIIVREILLSSIEITEEIVPDVCGPGDQIIVSGKVNFNFAKALPNPDIVVTKLRIEIVETGASWNVIPDLEGRYSHEILAPGVDGTYTVKATITRLGIFAEEERILTVESPKIQVDKQGAGIDFNTVIIATAVCSVAGGLGAFTAGTDLGRYKFFTLLIPLYTRINRKAVLDNFTRGRIYEHIRVNPGEHYRGIKDALELNNGCLTYHLKVLERENLIQSRTDGTYKRFYPYGMKISKGQPSKIQELLLDKILETPYITQRELAEQIGIDNSTVNYHINIMAGAGIIRSEKHGRVKQYYATSDYDAVSVKET
jgi:PKD repeat protein/DNA-binding MarR family transcriptional regulator